MPMFTKEQFPAMRAEIKEALAAIAKKYNCEVTIGNIKYDSTRADISLSLLSNGANGESAEQLQFNKLCYNYGFEPSDYNRVITDGKKHYHLVGFNPRARKNVCELLCEEDGKKYATGADVVARGFN